MRPHPDRRAVDEEPHPRQIGATERIPGDGLDRGGLPQTEPDILRQFLATLRSAGDNRERVALPRQGDGGGAGGAPRAQNQGYGSRPGRSDQVKQIVVQAVGVGVCPFPAGDAAVIHSHDGIDRADQAGLRADGVQQIDDRPLVGDGDVQPAHTRHPQRPQSCRQLAGPQRIGVIAPGQAQGGEGRVEHGRADAVGDRPPDQPCTMDRFGGHRTCAPSRARVAANPGKESAAQAASPMTVVPAATSPATARLMAMR